MQLTFSADIVSTTLCWLEARWRVPSMVAIQDRSCSFIENIFMMNEGLAPKKLKFGVIENNGMANDSVMQIKKLNK